MLCPEPLMLSYIYVQGICLIERDRHQSKGPAAKSSPFLLCSTVS